MAFPLERTTGKRLEVRFDFGPRPGFSKQLFGSSREGTKLDWTCFKQFLHLLFGGFVFCVFVSVLSFSEKKTKKGYFPAILEFFSSLVPPKALSLKSFSSSCSAFFLVSFCLPFFFSFKSPSSFFTFCPSTPFWQTFCFGGFLLSFFLFLC